MSLDLSVHNVRGIGINEIKSKNIGHIYHTVDIFIVGDEGDISISLFADTEDALKIKKAKSNFLHMFKDEIKLSNPRKEQP